MQWRLHLLGRFQLTVNGENTDGFEADSARALCAYLFMHTGETLRRERLAALFWPDQSQAGALRNLRTALSRMRRGIGRLSDALETDNQTVTFQPSPDVWVDALALASLNAEVEAHAHRCIEGCPLCVEKLQHIAELYRGEFLAGFTQESDLFLEWAAIQREIYHRAAIQALDALTAHHLLCHEWTDAQHYARRALQLEPWREESHRHLMLALAGQGQRSAALRQFHLCQQILQREFDAPPQPETATLYEQILGNRNVAVDANKRRTSMQLTPTGAHWLDDLPLVGREQELTELIDYLVSPMTRLITVVGEGGVGKTRLALRAARRTSLCFTDGAFHVGLNPEEQPDARRFQSMNTAVCVAQHIALACAIPLNDKETYEQSVLAFLRKRSVLLVLDGFEQHEGATPFLLTLLENAPACALLVTAHRPLYVRQEYVLRLEGLDVTPGVDEQAAMADGLVLFDALARRRGVVGVLDDAHRTAVTQICKAVGGLPLGIELAVACLPRIDRLQAASWSTEELAQLLQRADEPDEQTMVDLPPRHRGLRALFQTAWHLLEPKLQQTLAGVAIFHAAFTAEMAAAVLGVRKKEEAAQLLWQLAERSLVQPDDQGRFRLHDRIHRFAAEQLAASPARASIRERYTVIFLQKLAETEHALDGRDSYAIQQLLALEMEDLLAAWRNAVEDNQWSLLAGAAFAFARFHLLRGLYNEGERLLSDAVHRLRKVHCEATVSQRTLFARDDDEMQTSLSAEPAERNSKVLAMASLQWNGSASKILAQALARLFIAWSRLLARLDRREVVEAVLLEALDLTNDPGVRADALIELGWCLYHLGRTTDAQQPLNDALQLSAHLEDARRRAYALNGLAALYQRRGEGAQARRLLEEALTLTREEDDLTMTATILGNLGIYYGELSEHEQALTLLKEALTIHQAQHNLRMVANTLYSLGIHYDALGQYTEAQTRYRQALKIAESIGDRFAVLEIWINIGISCDQMGDYVGALEATLHAQAIEHEVSDPQACCTLLANLSLHYHHLGDQSQALLYANRAIELANAIEMPLMAAYGYDFLGHALLALSRADEAENAYQEALQLREQRGLAILGFESRAGLARVALARNDIQAAANWVEPIAMHLLHNELEGVEEPLRVYWTVFQVMQATNDPRAQPILARAVARLHQSADQISDPVSRQRYLTQVDAHHRLLHAGALDGWTGEVALCPPASDSPLPTNFASPPTNQP
jgi:DNA-binding SARP family transcriptional activator/predicted ATPase/Flp pilus assembly protein TadD